MHDIIEKLSGDPARSLWQKTADILYRQEVPSEAALSLSRSAARYATVVGMTEDVGHGLEFKDLHELLEKYHALPGSPPSE